MDPENSDRWKYICICIHVVYMYIKIYIYFAFFQISLCYSYVTLRPFSWYSRSFTSFVLFCIFHKIYIVVYSFVVSCKKMIRNLKMKLLARNMHTRTQMLK